MRPVVILSIVLVPMAQFAFAEQVTCTNSYSGTQTRTYTLPPGTLNPGRNQLDRVVRGDDFEGSKGDIGKTFYTPELTTFSDQTCSRGPCNHSTPGTAHRSWPIGACVAICNLRTKDCAIAVVMDRGPNTALGCRTIDGNIALKQKLKLTGITPATYQLLKLRGPCDTGGPISVPTPDPAGGLLQSGPGPGTSAGGVPVGTPTQVGSPAQSAYRQPADFSNYQSPSPTQVSPYFSPQQQGAGGWNLPQTPIYQSSSTADYLLNLISGTPGRPSTTPQRRVTVMPGTVGRVATSTKPSDTVIVTPLAPARVPQTFTPALTPYDETPAPVASVLADMVRQLQMIFDRVAAFFRGS